LGILDIERVGGDGVTALEFVVDPGMPADASRFFGAGTSLVELLDALSEAPLPWIIEDLKLGSAVARIGLDRSATSEEVRYSADAARTLSTGFRLLDGGRTLTDDWHPGAVAHARMLATYLAPTGSKQYGHLRVVDGASVDEVPVTPAVADALRSMRSVTMESVGSVRGRIMGVNFSRGNRASVKPSVGRTVQVAFDDKLRELIKDNVLSVALLSGEVRRDESGATYHIRAHEVELLPERGDRRLRDLYGLDPDFTGGVDPDDYLGILRGEA
jgi:hypothetical protein